VPSWSDPSPGHAGPIEEDLADERPTVILPRQNGRIDVVADELGHVERLERRP
jgi:hypothetical protein